MQNLDQFKVPKGFRGRHAVVVQLWWLVQATLFACSPHFMNGWRCWLLQCFGATIGKKVVIRSSARFTYPWKVTIGDYSWVGESAEFYSYGHISVGSHSVVSQKCYLCTGSHDYKSEAFDLIQKPIIIGDKVWLATDVFVAPGITIGDGAIVGARSTVLSNVDAYTINFGNPAEYKKQRAQCSPNTR